ncbi:MAG: 50S ribosomal protein L25 [bacterium ADurb.Bin212]|nr:MAG: 50S ribosomal protein L25 [bacterium ADurb.Bin212]
MTDFKFNAKTRKETARQSRKSGFIPAVIYGKSFENINIELPELEFIKVIKEAGTSNLIDLKIDSEKSLKTLIQDVQRHPTTGAIIHVDLLKIDMKEKIKTDIPLEFINETPLVVEQEGTLVTNKDSVEVECLPSDLVDHINVDISVLTDFDMNIKVEDIRVPSGMEILDDPEEVIVMVQPPRSEEELEALDEAVVEDVEAVEVEKAGADEEGSEEGTKEDNKEE